jgi:hypothetical protein
VRGRSTIVGGGIQAGTPFTLNAFTFVGNTNPATIVSSPVMAAVGGANPAVVIAAGLTDPQPAATEILRVKGGFISEALGTGNPDTFVAGRGTTTFPNNSTNVIAIIPHGASLGAGALPGTILIGDSITVSAGVANSIYMGKSLTCGQPGVIIAPQSTIGSGAGGSNTVVGGSNTLTSSQAASSTCIFGHSNTVDGGSGQGNHLVVGPNNTIHATATLGGNVILVGNGNFASDGSNNSIMVGINNGFSVSGKGTFNILMGRNLQANGAAGPFASNILIGFGTKFDALPSASGVIAFLDSQNTGYNTIIFGNGGGSGTTVVSATPSPLLFRLTDASGANTAGSNLTMRASLGTGTGAGGTIIFQTGIVQAAGATPHVPTARVTVGGTNTVPTLAVTAPDSNTAIPVITLTGQANNHAINYSGFTNQAAAAVGTLNNAPAAGNPAFWVPIEVNGVLRAFPVW